MTNYLIGSRALSFVEQSFVCRSDADWDVISDAPIDGCEWHDANLLNNSAISKYATDIVVTLPNGNTAFVVGRVGLSLIKRSHLHRNIGFDKHIAMYHKHLKQHETVWYQRERNFLAERIRLTDIAFPQQGPNLNQMKDDFFDDAVTKKYDHDYLHQLVAFNDVPMYTKMLRNDGTVFCRKEVWDTFSHYEKVMTVIEEVLVIAVERFMIPNNWNFNPRIAFNRALKKVCTTLCKGWFRDFAIDNYPELLAAYSRELVFTVKFKLGE